MRTIAALLLLPITTVLAAEGWLTDLDVAKKQAATEHKDILIDFTGSDWCIWCKRLDGEVFSTPEFKAQKDFVLVSLDFPRDRQIPADEKARNLKLKSAWGVSGYPTIVLANADGQPYARTGYQRGGPVSYLSHLAELRKQNTAEGIKAFANEVLQINQAMARRQESNRKMEAALAAKDFEAACKLIDENFGNEKPGARVAANFNKAIISMQMDPKNKDRALRYADEALAEAEKTGDANLVASVRRNRDQMAADSEAAKAAK